MASQFQNRIVGAVVLVALGVIILPSIFDGHKKYYQNEFPAIPIIPQPESQTPTNALPPATQPLPDPVIPTTNSGSQQPLTIDNSGTTLPGNQAPGTITIGSVATAGTTTTGSPVTGSTTTPETTGTTTPPVVGGTQATTTTTPPTSGSTQPQPTAPKGKAYVVQLAALTNAAKVQEIRATLSFANYTVFTIPTTPVQGKPTRILVGPDASRQKLERALPELERLTGLKGVVKEHKVTN